MTDISLSLSTVQNMLSREAKFLLLIQSYCISNDLCQFFSPRIARTNTLHLKPVVCISDDIVLCTQIVVRG